MNIRFQDQVLANGLRVIVYPDNAVPLVHVSLHYRVGSSSEEPGRSGLAHLFEHMMFEGSENVAKNEHGRLLDAAGGAWNASTNKDRTNYYATVPSNYVDLALWLEADRMRSLRITSENFENQRQTVIEEKKQSYDNRPYGRAHLRFDELAYENWAYAHPIVGSVEDLQKLTLEEAVEFHSRFYGPGNCVLVIAGDVKEAEALKKAEQYFGSVPDQTTRFSPDLAEPRQSTARHEVHHDALAALPAVMFGFHMPELGAPDYYALSVLSLALTQGESSRLYRKMIYDNTWVTGIFSGPNQYKGPELYTVWAQLQGPASPETVVAETMHELERTGSDGILATEIEKASNNLRHAFLSRLTRVSQVGETLAYYAVYFDDPELINSELDRFLAVRPGDIREAAERTFRPENQTLITVLPGRQNR